VWFIPFLDTGVGGTIIIISIISIISIIIVIIIGYWVLATKRLE